MKYFSGVFIIMISVAVAFTSCNKKPVEKGAATPKALFERMKKVEGNNLADIVDFITPDELPFLSFSMDMTVTMITSMGRASMTFDEYQKIRKKYKIPKLDKKAMLVMRDPVKAKKIAKEKYDKVNHKAFISEVQNIIGKDKRVKKYNNVKDAVLKDIKINGDRAVIFIDSREKGINEMKLRKYQGRWYLSLVDTYQRR